MPDLDRRELADEAGKAAEHKKTEFASAKPLPCGPSTVAITLGANSSDKATARRV